MYNYPAHSINCPGLLLIDGEGKLARRKLRYVSPRPNKVAKRIDAVRREAGKA